MNVASAVNLALDSELIHSVGQCSLTPLISDRQYFHYHLLCRLARPARAWHCRPSVLETSRSLAATVSTQTERF